MNDGLLREACHRARSVRTRGLAMTKWKNEMTKDLDDLTKLNKDYIDSVQNCDVKRFDEILAEDFYCTNFDKSLVDRAAFLKQTAIPVKIRNLKAEDVKIRILGDFAIIHARTSYTTPDGEQAHGCYTDCWARQNGRWLAVSAHVAR
jgi:ketosteroid isomerase-like protein